MRGLHALSLKLAACCVWLQVMRDVLPHLMQGSELPDVETMMTAPRVRERLPSFRGIMANVKGASESTRGLHLSLLTPQQNACTRWWHCVLLLSNFQLMLLLGDS